MAKAYLVTTGSYSDYSVRGVFSTRENAERAKDVWATENEIEEYDLDVMPQTPPGLLGWQVSMHENGDAQAGRCGFEAEDKTGLQFISEWNSPPNALFYCWARDEAHAVKIASEWRREMLASGDWQKRFSEANEKRAEIDEKIRTRRW